MGDIYDHNAPDDTWWERERVRAEHRSELRKLKRRLDPAVVRYIELYVALHGKDRV